MIRCEFFHGFWLLNEDNGYCELTKCKCHKSCLFYDERDFKEEFNDMIKLLNEKNKRKNERNKNKLCIKSIKSKN